MSGDYERVAAAIRFIEESVTEQPSIEAIALAAGVSVSHCQRLFRRWAGVSPKRFLQFLTVQHAKALLDESANVLETSLQSGLSGPSRLHDQFISIEAVSPGEYQRRGNGLEIRYGHHSSPFGEIMLALTDRGICGLSFCEVDNNKSELARLKKLWPGASFRQSDADTAELARRLEHPPDVAHPLSLLVTGTNFQIKIWQALLRIPSGAVCTYGQLASLAGEPGSARATGTAIGSNHIAWLIPCHRVIRSTGQSGQYRWGSVRKQALLAWEAGRHRGPAITAAAS
ncbi:MAG: bifunctional helix-turn-helix domain-containing protein/methylated-DNA--[protein]-cysteine S-methyltransferase [Gammaproteobacteria bacterium]|nr:bifunctional helix-turn-helix domain-containing protein/methylated-DNA--[protein]-cysteine S-methyltransferase [Gammaproteobacteria bacterium]MDH3768920.1 bifunctional helix-turn-helix domain-containing protein/methylated-DNA--[protein]-cysteine S-methyltransferase [Gammaproteobacteria bacterium]